jgi:type IX secretion system PorP/SprF family membrane protein
MMKKIVLISILWLIALEGFSQQDPQYSLYMFNPIGVNPGYAGRREVLSAVLVHRSQWIGLEGAPETQAFSLNMPLNNKKMGVGLQIVNDKIGAHTTQTLKATYAYRLKLGNGKLAFGLSGGILNYNFDWGKIDYKQQEDVVPNQAPERIIIPTVDFV